MAREARERNYRYMLGRSIFLLFYWRLHAINLHDTTAFKSLVFYSTIVPLAVSMGGNTLAPRGAWSTRGNDTSVVGVPQKICDILVGSLLGDAYASPHGKGEGNTRIEFKQGMMHFDYLIFIWFQFLFWGFTTAFVPFPKPTGDGRGGTHPTVRFRTRRLEVLNPFRDLFYLDGVKIVPAIIGQLLTARAFAYWICDDGGYLASGMLLHTNAFTKSDVELLIFVLNTNFGIKANIRVKGKVGLSIFQLNIYQTFEQLYYLTCLAQCYTKFMRYSNNTLLYH
ncbi:homing endonuclease [Jimgerdemannia flammicorona]|uniref:Homing endonuclease n=1 Tax=Jimgerdemannia flammicorona TaxID=994334 RepID=A0A433CXV8_9FUNG|nr:homing endonuclease [Jimgerdemannia flammicorona]